MPLELRPIPEIPEELRVAAARGTLLPFVGAGLSRLAGCPDWAEFADRALREFVATGQISHGHLRQLGQLQPRVKLSIALALAKTTGTSIDFKKLLTVENPSLYPAGQDAYGHLARLATVFVTTNYDELLDNMPLSTGGPSPSSGTQVVNTPLGRREVVFEPEHFEEAHLRRPGTVIHLHGSVKNPASMLLTAGQYLARYASHRPGRGPTGENPYRSFLETLFEIRNVVFIGYGLEELEILEPIVQRAIPPRVGVRTSEPRHFVLQGFFAHEVALMNSLGEYYREEYKIQLLPFSREERDWAQLAEVLKQFSNEIPSGMLLASRRLREMERFLE